MTRESISDLVSLQKESPNAYEVNSTIGSYDLLFHISDRSRGLRYFYTKMSLYEDGRAANEINLPDINADPSKANIISCKDAKVIAAESGFPRKYQSVEFDYSATADAFVWIVSDGRPVERDKSGDLLDLVKIAGQGTYRRIEINANTGKVLRIYKRTIII